MLRAVLDLGMSHTMERDDILHGFLYGNESLADLDIARGLFQTESDNLQADPEHRPMILEEIVWPRFHCFADRLNARLHDLELTGQPEISRQVEFTLRTLELLRDCRMATVPPPASQRCQPIAWFPINGGVNERLCPTL